MDKKSLYFIHKLCNCSIFRILLLTFIEICYFVPNTNFKRFPECVCVVKKKKIVNHLLILGYRRDAARMRKSIHPSGGGGEGEEGVWGTYFRVHSSHLVIFSE